MLDTLNDYDFAFTKEYTVDSSAVGRAFYNADEKYVVVTLQGGTYRYDNVEQSFADDIENVYSVGGSWLPVLKRRYGPGTYLGEFSDLEFESLDVLKAAAEAAKPEANSDEILGEPGVFSVGDRVKVVSNLGDSYGYRGSGGRVGHVGEYGTVEDYDSIFGYSGSFTSVLLDNGIRMAGALRGRFARVESVKVEKNEISAPDLRLTAGSRPNTVTGTLSAADLSVKPEYVPLKVVSDNSTASDGTPLRKFVVAFTSNGSEEAHDYSLFAPDWNSAETEIVNLGNMLGLDFAVKGMSVLD